MLGDFKILAFVRCLFRGHEYRVSRSHADTVTCMRCHHRKAE